ncbi:hypothetical protein KNP414_06098 [Paenibacillus mucilaginosus KNP414]|uniref:Uncharacterized protein n=1 Tax=Paenibacillus mucilaginosus (strain KNP414) TaxID=1036673 RepID=F8FGG2_PAEMK|nr:hypothetical protein KNP414_06098 [Paenibacillus mucilaginosus KNP414]
MISRRPLSSFFDLHLYDKREKQRDSTIIICSHPYFFAHDKNESGVGQPPGWQLPMIH